jgi:Sulfotransferase domain
MSDLPILKHLIEGREEAIFSLPPSRNSNKKSTLVFALPKAGSVLLDKIMRQLAAHEGLTYVSIMQEFFNQGLPSAAIPPQTSELFLEHGYVYGGFRNFPTEFEIPILNAADKILLVRDPRDMLVSHYYSMRDSHPEPGRRADSKNGSPSAMAPRAMARSSTVDEYVLNIAPHYRTYLRNYFPICKMPNTKLYKYEDIIYDKVSWIEDISAYLGFSVPRSVVIEIADKYDTIPRRENQAKHVRQVHPGNYLRKLKPETIQQLSSFLHEELDFYGYAGQENNVNAYPNWFDRRKLWAKRWLVSRSRRVS